MTLDKCPDPVGCQVCYWPREQVMPAFGSVTRMSATRAFVAFPDRIHPVGIAPNQLTLIREADPQ